ncbi:MAG: inorganic triphosphatase [Sideroxydans sp.]
MALETELKLHIEPADLGRLQRHPLLRELSIGRARTLQLHSIYFDTPELTLQQQRMALRLRRQGRRWLQTLKGGGQTSAGLHQRQEWEVPVSGDQLDLAALQASGMPLAHDISDRLRPVFVTIFKRQVRLLRFGDAEIELALDSGEIRSGQQAQTISELELELKSGAPLRLFELALLLLEIVPLRIEHTSKAEYGYRLFRTARPEPRKARFPALSGTQPAATALRQLAGICLTHVQDNLPGALLGQDTEFLHQVRVGLRRLRVVLAASAKLNADVHLQTLRDEVAQLCVALGRLREWDVFVTQTLPALPSDLLPPAEAQRLARLAQHRRQQVASELRQRLADRAFQRLFLQLGAWLQAAPPQHGPSFADFSRRTLKKSARRVANAGKRLQVNDARQLHALRIACKKWRYALEMFQWSGKKQRSKEAEALSGLQSVLGQLNDLVVAERLLDELKWAAAKRVQDGLLQQRQSLLPNFYQAWQSVQGKDGNVDQA